MFNRRAALMTVLAAAACATAPAAPSRPAYRVIALAPANPSAAGACRVEPTRVSAGAFAPQKGSAMPPWSSRAYAEQHFDSDFFGKHEYADFFEEGLGRIAKAFNATLGDAMAAPQRDSLAGASMAPAEAAADSRKAYSFNGEVIAFQPPAGEPRSPMTMTVRFGLREGNATLDTVDVDLASPDADFTDGGRQLASALLPYVESRLGCWRGR